MLSARRSYMVGHELYPLIPKRVLLKGKPQQQGTEQRRSNEAGQLWVYVSCVGLGFMLPVHKQAEHKWRQQTQQY